MIEIKRNFYLVNIKDTWFYFENRISNLFTLRSYSFIKNVNRKNNTLCVKYNSHTIELSLEKKQEEITKQFSSNIKNEVKRAQKYNFLCDFENNTEEFISIYNDFAKLKNLYPANKKTIEYLGDSFKTTFVLLNNEIIAAHSYIIDRHLGIVRLYQSCSKRLDSNFNKEVTGIANKLLTIEDIFYFKGNGFKTYDFGGYAYNTQNESLKGINQFKMQFGGKITTCVNYNTLGYHILKKISEKIDFRYK